MPISWHPRDVSLPKVCAGDQLANQYRKHYQESDLALLDLAGAIANNAWAPIRWRHGQCHSANFIDSSLMVLDFDETDYTIAQAMDDWADSVHIIGTTKSHQIEKEGKPAKDRFRVIVPWAVRVTSARVYSHNLTILIKAYGADPTCSDPARFFWPCREVISVNETGYLQPVKIPSEPERLHINEARRDQLRRDLFAGAIPLWIADFVHRGRLPKNEKLLGSRKWACFAVAAKLRELGWGIGDVSALLHGGKFNRTGFDGEEIDAAVKSAFKKEQKKK